MDRNGSLRNTTNKLSTPSFHFFSIDLLMA